MSRHRDLARAPNGRAAPVRRARDPDEVGLAIRPGVIVETDMATAEACGAWAEDCTDARDAFDAAEDPASFGRAEWGPDGAP